MLGVGPTPELLLALLDRTRTEKVLVFTRTKHGANRLTKQLVADGLSAAAIHGNKSQAQRTRALAEFKQGDIRVLVATDIAARGIDVESLPHVINFDVPDEAENYVHRIGRTGRAGASGEAISLVSRDDFRNLCAIEQHLGYFVTREVVEGFAPKLAVPASNSDYAPKSASKSRRRQSNRR